MFLVEHAELIEDWHLPPRARLLYYINVLAPRLSDRLSRFFRLEGWTE